MLVYKICQYCCISLFVKFSISFFSPRLIKQENNMNN